MRARPQQPMATDAEGRTVGPQPPRRAAVESSVPARVEAVTLCCCGGAMDIVRRSGCIQAVKLRSTCKLFELAIDIDARAAAPIMHRSCTIQHTARH